MASVTALGMIETIGLVSAIEAADAGLKAAQVRLLGTDYVRGGLVMVRFEGEVAAVKAAVDAGAAGSVGSAVPLGVSVSLSWQAHSMLAAIAAHSSRAISFLVFKSFSPSISCAAMAAQVSIMYYSINLRLGNRQACKQTVAAWRRARRRRSWGGL